MKDETLQLKGYVDPRTGDYVVATEANREQVTEGLGFMMAWKFYWDGPSEATQDQKPIFTREDWITSERRATWVNSLSDEQRQMLEDSFPPEEVPKLERLS